MSTPEDTRDTASSRSAGGQGSGTIRSFDEERLAQDIEAALARFTFQPPRPDDGPRYEAISLYTRALAEAIVRNVPPGRERSTALTALSDARMHANAGIALAGTKGA